MIGSVLVPVAVRFAAETAPVNTAVGAVFVQVPVSTLLLFVEDCRVTLVCNVLLAPPESTFVPVPALVALVAVSALPEMELVSFPITLLDRPELVEKVEVSAFPLMLLVSLPSTLLDVPELVE